MYGVRGQHELPALGIEGVRGDCVIRLQEESQVDSAPDEMPD